MATIYLSIGSSAFTLSDRGEVLETVERDENGQPDWNVASIRDTCGDLRSVLPVIAALQIAERCARSNGYKPDRVQGP